MPVDTAAQEGVYGDWQPTADELERLGAIFPDGVCDYDLAGMGDPRVDVAGAPQAGADGVALRVWGVEPGAEVQLRTDGQVLETRTANPAGRATFAGLAPGDYVVAQVVDGQRSQLSSVHTVVHPRERGRMAR